MDGPPPQQSRSRLTLALGILLHLFTHAYGAMLVPLYLMIQADLHLKGIQYAALLVTVYGVVYYIVSYGAGMLADRMNRRNLLGWGLVINAIAVVLMGLTRRYEMLLLLSVIAGLAGTLFHPAANALIPAHYPKSPGMAIGILGIGSGLGFFIGPQYAGWRAVHAGWHWRAVANWQRPCIELGVMGLVCGLAFLVFAREAPGHDDSRPVPQPMSWRLRWNVIGIALTLGCRDFAGLASLSLTSIYLLRAMGRDAASVGFTIGIMMLIGVVANPVAVWISPGRRRLPMLAITMLVAGLIVCTVPWFSGTWVLPALCIFQWGHLGSYAMSDAAMLERVSPSHRGRVAGLFLNIAGTAASLSPWIMGAWTDAFGPRAAIQSTYYAPFITLGAMMIFAIVSVPLIAKLGKSHPGAVHPLEEIAPATMEAVM
jgi:MFS family permease